MDISEQSAQDALVSHVSNGGKLDGFARHHGMSRSTLQRRLRTMPDLQERLDAARRRGAIVARHSNMASMPAHAERVDTVKPEPAPVPYDRSELLELIWNHANDKESRGCAKALGILAEYEFGAEVHAARKAAEREGIEETGARTRRVVNVDLPEPGSRRVLDAEVVDT